MKFKLADNLYTKYSSEKKFKKFLIKIKLKRPVNNLYVVTAPLYEAGIMEIYNYNELLQPFYRKQKRVISILGVSKTRDEAKELVCDILEDTYSTQGNADIKTYFGLGSI